MFAMSGATMNSNPLSETCPSCFGALPTRVKFCIHCGAECGPPAPRVSLKLNAVTSRLTAVGAESPASAEPSEAEEIAAPQSSAQPEGTLPQPQAKGQDAPAGHAAPEPGAFDEDLDAPEQAPASDAALAAPDALEAPQTDVAGPDEMPPSATPAPPAPRAPESAAPLPQAPAPARPVAPTPEDRTPERPTAAPATAAPKRPEAPGAPSRNRRMAKFASVGGLALVGVVAAAQVYSSREPQAPAPLMSPSAPRPPVAAELLARALEKDPDAANLAWLGEPRHVRDRQSFLEQWNKMGPERQRHWQEVARKNMPALYEAQGPDAFCQQFAHLTALGLFAAPMTELEEACKVHRAAAEDLRWAEKRINQAQGEAGSLKKSIETLEKEAERTREALQQRESSTLQLQAWIHRALEPGMFEVSELDARGKPIGSRFLLQTTETSVPPIPEAGFPARMAVRKLPDRTVTLKNGTSETVPHVLELDRMELAATEQARQARAKALADLQAAREKFVRAEKPADVDLKSFRDRAEAARKELEDRKSVV